VAATDPTPIAGIDIDGVLADPTHRLHHLAGRPKNWRGFFSEARHDGPLKTGISVVAALVASGLAIRYVSGRPEVLREDTLEWFAEYDLPSAPLTLRPRGDYRPAPIWKLEVYSNLAKQAEIRTIVDDDVRVVEVLRAAGFQVRHADWYTPPADQSARLIQAQDELGRS
jgi:hypothetical protein